MTTSVFPWPPEAICLHPDSPDAGAVAEPAYQRTCRTDFAAPGFCVIHLGRDLEPVGFRRFMVELKQAMAAIHESRTGKTLAFRSAQRFDQQQDTRPHLDGGPDECFLLLGYEPTEVEARLEVFDYARCAFDLGITPKAFMAEHNPMFDGGYERLRPYATPVPCFAGRDYRVLCINNSSAAYSDAQPAWQGVLHTATMVTPDADKHRVIDYTLVASVPAGTADAIEPASLDLFISGPGDG